MEKKVLCSQLIGMLLHTMSEHGDIPVVLYDMRSGKVVPADNYIVHDVTNDDDLAHSHKELSICW